MIFRRILTRVLIGCSILLTGHDALADEIKIGLVGTVSGQYAVIGQRIVNGALLAVEQHNQRSPHKAKLLIQDSRFEANTSIAAFRKLADADKVDAFITSDSVTIDTLHPMLRKLGSPVIQLAEMGYEPEADNIFQASEEFMICGGAIAEALNAEPVKQAVVVYADYRAFERLVQNFSAKAKFPFQQISVDPKEVSLGFIMPRVLALNPSHIVLMMAPVQSGSFVKELRLIRKQSLPIYFEEDLLVDLTGFKSQVSDLNVINSDFVSLIDRSTNPDFVAQYRARFKEEPDYAEYGYDAVAILLQTYSKEQSDWLKNIQSLNWSGATGPISFDSRGVRIGRAKVMNVAEAIKLRAKT